MSSILAKFGGNLDVDKLLALARIAETAERYEGFYLFCNKEIVKKQNNHFFVDVSIIITTIIITILLRYV